MPTLAAMLLGDVNKYSDDQERDDHGRFGSGGSGGSKDSSSKPGSGKPKTFASQAEAASKRAYKTGLAADHKVAAQAHRDARSYHNANAREATKVGKPDQATKERGHAQYHGMMVRAHEGKTPLP